MITRRDLKVLRAIHGYTQKDLSDILGINHSSYRNYEVKPENLPEQAVVKLKEMLKNTHYSFEDK